MSGDNKLVKLDVQTKAQQATNSEIQNLREEMKQLQATMDDLRKKFDEKCKTESLLVVQPENACVCLLEAIMSGDVNAVKLYAKSAKDSCATNDDLQHTPLTLAAAIGRVDVVRVLLDSGASIGKMNSRGWTPLHVAAFHGHLEVCRLLLERGANVKALTSRKKNSPLNCAARTGHLSVVQLLVQSGADTGYRNVDGVRALELASIKGHHKLASWLTKYP